MTSSLVLVDQAFGRHAIQNWLCSRESSLSSSFVTRCDRCNNFLDESTGHRTTAGVVLAGFLCLDSALLSRFNVSQGKTPEKTVLASVLKRSRNMPSQPDDVNQFCANNHRTLVATQSADS